MKTGLKFAEMAIIAAGLCAGGCSKPGPTPLEQSPVSGQLRHFIVEKKAQATAAVAADGHELLPETKSVFAAAEKGDWLTVSNVFEDLRASKYSGKDRRTSQLNGTEWETVKEIWGAFNYLASDAAQDKYSVALGQDIIASIPAGSIYFGGTDAGRWVITALQASQVNGDPFFTLSQNPLCDPGYLDYLRRMYGTKIYVPTTNDSQQCFSDYMEDAQRRVTHDRNFPKEPKQIRPGEDVVRDSAGNIQVSSHVSVMAINALLAKVVFEHETNRQFFVEESFPLDWMYPYLEPHGLIMKLDREPLTQLSDEMVRKDHEFWSGRVAQVIGDWLTYDTSVRDVCDFAQKVYVKHDFNGFKGDPRFVSDDWPKWMSKLRSSIANIYLWRIGMDTMGETVPPEYLAKEGVDRARMIREADFALRQAFALAPDSPETVFRYVNFLMNQKRTADAIAIAEVASAAHADKPDGDQIRYLLRNLKDIQKAGVKKSSGKMNLFRPDQI